MTMRRCVMSGGLLGLLLAGLATAALASSPPEADTPDLTIGEITILSSDIFSEDEVQNTTAALRLLRNVMNGLHVNTRDYVLRQELLFEPGDAFDPLILDETERTLRNIGYLNNVVITPVDTTADGRVNVLVSARESWTLNTSINYSRAASGDQRWSFKLSERNFLGHGLTLGAGVGEDEDGGYWSAWTNGRRLLGTDLQFGLNFSKRDDGHTRSAYIYRPFYALSDDWSLYVFAEDQLSESRYYLSHASPAGLDPTTSESLYARLPYGQKTILTHVLWRITGRDEGAVWRLGPGIRIQERDVNLDKPWAYLSDDRWANLSWMNDPEHPLASIQGTMVFPHLEVQLTGRNWTKSSFVRKYGSVEDVALDWNLAMRFGLNGTAVGSNVGSRSRARFEGEIAKWTPLLGGYLMTDLLALGETGTRTDRNHRVDLTLGWLTQFGNENSPWLTRLFTEVGHGSRLVGHEAFRLGLARGLRTLDYDGMAGDRLVRWNIEQGKATDWEVLGLFRMGAAGFYSGGCAWWNDENRSIADARHEAGFGLRFGPTRSGNSQIARLDLTWNLDGSTGPVFTAQTRGFF